MSREPDKTDWDIELLWRSVTRIGNHSAIPGPEGDECRERMRRAVRFAGSVRIVMSEQGIPPYSLFATMPDHIVRRQVVLRDEGDPRNCIEAQMTQATWDELFGAEVKP